MEIIIAVLVTTIVWAIIWSNYVDSAYVPKSKIIEFISSNGDLKSYLDIISQEKK